MASKDEYLALEAFVVENPELEQLEASLEKFNIFEALGAVRQELKHSNFLAFLFDPNQNHGLGEAFLKRFLKKALSDLSSTDLSITPIDFDAWDLNDAVVLREWQNIDIFVFEENLKIAMVIENKIDSSESPGQLKRYRDTIEKHYPDYKKMFFFLTPDGSLPSDDHYIPVSYDLILDVLVKIAEIKETTLGSDVLALIRNYIEMLRRHIVSESEISKLCQKIYQKHHKALDMIFEHKPDLQADIRNHLETLVANTPDILKDQMSKSYVRFLPKEWDIACLTKGKGWLRSNRILLFEIENTTNNIALRLIIGPGEQEIRKKLYEIVRTNKIFKTSRELPPKWCTIFARKFVTKNDLQDNAFDTIAVQIGKQWERFIATELPEIRKAINDSELIP